MKTFAEQAREGILTSDNRAGRYQAMEEARRENAAIKAILFEVHGEIKRSKISPATQLLVDAVLNAIYVKLKGFHPVSDRQIHYQIVHDPVLKHASKPKFALR